MRRVLVFVLGCAFGLVIGLLLGGGAGSLVGSGMGALEGAGIGACQAGAVAVQQGILDEATADRVVTAALADLHAKAPGLTDARTGSLATCRSSGDLDMLK